MTKIRFFAISSEHFISKNLSKNQFFLYEAVARIDGGNLGERGFETSDCAVQVQLIRRR